MLLLGMLISCTSDDEGGLTELVKNRQLWESSEVTSYVWTENISCFCAGVLQRRLTVINGSKQRVEFDESRLPPNQTAEDILEDTNSIAEAFDLIEDIMNQNPASLTIEYHGEYGFPTLISVDYAENTADDEIVYSYSDFALLILN